MRRGGVVAGWIGLVRRRWPWGLGVGALVLGLAAAVVLLSRPIYRGEAQLRLGEAPPSPGVGPTGGFLGLFRMGGDPFANDLELLGSRTMAEYVVEEVALNVKLAAPRGWYRDSLFTAVRASRDTEESVYELTWEGDGSISVHRVSPRDSTVGTFAVGEPVRFGGVELVPGPPRPDAPAIIRVSLVPFGEAVRSARSRVSVERTRREANVVRIRYDDPDPRVAEDAVRSTVAGFMALRSRLLDRESGETVDSLRGVAERTLAELAVAETALVALQSSSGLVAVDAQSEAAVERLSEAETELATARQELNAITKVLARVQAEPEAATAWTALVAYPRFLENETMGTLLTRLIQLEEERMALAGRRTEESLEYRTIVAQMEYLDGSLRSLATSTRVALEERIAALLELVGSMRTQLAAVPAQAVELARRQREIRLLSAVFVATEQRLRQEELREALTFSNVQVIDPPALDPRPVWPRKRLGLAVGMVLALGFALLAMLVVESADATVRSASELSALSGAPVLVALAVNGRLTPAAPPEASALLMLGRGSGGALPPLVVAAVDGNGGDTTADDVRAALAAGGWEGTSRDVRLCAPVTSYASAREALALGGPVLLVVVRGETEIPDVERAVRLLREAGGAAAGMVVVCRSEAEAGELWT